METATMELAKSSILGAVFIIVILPLGAYVMYLAKALRETQDKRTQDAQAMIDKLLLLNDKWNSSITEQMRLVETIEETLRDVKQALRELRDSMLMRRSGD